MKISKFHFFSGKIVTSFAYIFTMEKALVNIIFVRKIFMCQPIFKFFVALFTTFGIQKDSEITLCCRSSNTRRYEKRQFPKDGVRRVGGTYEQFSHSSSHWVIVQIHA